MFSLTYWRRILLINLAGALAVVGIRGGFSPGARWDQVSDALTMSLIFANCIGVLLALVIPQVAAVCWRRDIRLRWALLVATAVIVTTMGVLLAQLVGLAIGRVPREMFWPWFVESLGTSIAISLILCIAFTAYNIIHTRLEMTTIELRTKERDEAEARRIATEAQLASLESRVNPHFLFNTLNSIAALVHDDPTAAERVTEQLAALMRSSLDHQAPLVSLEDELRVVRAYLDIEQVRFGDRLRSRFNIDREAAGAQVPRLSLQTLVENSVKYAVCRQRGGASIAVRTATANGRLRLEVEDDGPGFEPAAVVEGHGLALLRARLAMTFGGRATLAIDSRPGCTRVSIDLPADGR